jgi:hypothetical protein
MVDVNGLDASVNATDANSTTPRVATWGNNGTHLFCGTSVFPAPGFTQLAGNDLQLPPLLDPATPHPPGWFVWARENPDSEDPAFRIDDTVASSSGKFSKTCVYLDDDTMFTAPDVQQMSTGLQEYDVGVEASGRLAKYVTSGLEGPADAVLPTLLAGKTCVIVPAMRSGASASGKSNFDVSTLLHPAEIGALQSFLASGGNIVQLAVPNQRSWSFLSLFLDTSGSGPTRPCVERAPRLNLATTTIVNTEFVFAPAVRPVSLVVTVCEQAVAMMPVWCGLGIPCGFRARHSMDRTLEHVSEQPHCPRMRNRFTRGLLACGRSLRSHLLRIPPTALRPLVGPSHTSAASKGTLVSTSQPQKTRGTASLRLPASHAPPTVSQMRMPTL